MANDLNGRFVVRLRLAGILAVLGLAVQMGTLFEAHPVTFITFLVAGAGLVVAGFVALVWAMATQS